MGKEQVAKALVCGGSGFLGSHVADALSEAGHAVTVFDVRPSPYLRSDQQGVVGDILDFDRVSAAIKGCDIVYNYAGIADIAAASENPLETVRTNVLGNTILLEAARHAGVRRFVFASTLYVYSQAGAFYRSSKQACELIIEDYQKAYGLPYTILRYGSLYGPRADEANWIHNMLKQALTEGRIVRYGDGEEIREYIHVWDAAQSSVDILAPEFENANVIISGHQSIRIKDLLTMIREMLGNNVIVEYRAPENTGSSSVPGLHYQITPYSFHPKMARRFMRSSYLDFGQGLLDLMNQIHQTDSSPLQRGS